MTTLRPVLLSFVPCVLVACSSASQSPFTPTSSASAPSSSSASAPSTPGLVTDVTGGPGAGTCVPSAPSTFADAICVCEDLGEAGVLRTHATAPAAASVGVNGRVGAATGSSIEGSLVAYQALAVAGGLDVRDSALSTGDVSGAGVLHVGGDLSVGGDLAFAGDLQVGGALRLAQPGIVLPGATSGSTATYVAPSAPPCTCDPSSLLPIAQMVASAASKNDNAGAGLGTTGADLVGAGTLSLDTGTYYFHDVTRVGVGAVAINGAVALYIDGSIAEVGDAQITLAAGASLDLYVSGVVASAGRVVLGDPSHPEAFRLFVGGAGSMMATAGSQVWAGLVYAPQADVTFAGITQINGAVFAKSLAWAGILDVTYGGATTGASCSPSQDDAGAGSSPGSPSSPSSPSSPPSPSAPPSGGSSPSDPK